jgi:hypothetical protein
MNMNIATEYRNLPLAVLTESGTKPEPKPPAKPEAKTGKTAA